MTSNPATRRTVVQGLLALCAVGCNRSAPRLDGSGRAPSDRMAAEFSFDGNRPGLDQGQKSPPLPPELEIWDWDAGGFVGDPIWYGEHDWDGVRMRLMGHLAWLGRERARLVSRRGELDAARSEIVQAQRDLQRAAPRRRNGVAASLHRTLVHAMARDVAIFDSLRGTPVPIADDAAAVIGSAIVRQDPSRLLARLESAPPALDIDEFQNFDERHKLRVKQWAAWGTIGDPIGLVPNWGYFNRRVWLRIHRGLVDRSQAIQATTSPKATLVALATTAPEEAVPIEVDDLASLPTGDSLIDTVAAPGPRAIGRLWMMGDDDGAYMDWLAVLAEQLSGLADADPSGVVTAIRTAVAALNQHTHGSRFYNVKQLRNAGVRVLASRGHHAEAAKLLADQRPLHNQDWACPNRAGILRSLEARTAMASGDLESAAAALEEASNLARTFLKNVAQAEQTPGHGLKPPGFGPPPPGARPPQQKQR
ncbi:MAG: hypothetical protein CL927_04050 [Deltaproteobacteria bacterium]|nr:hypothetical protein [Deltaproteobacteria bacterium]HCH66685.1 hypothetical protein [Deltaproteobacteria bacterium]